MEEDICRYSETPTLNYTYNDQGPINIRMTKVGKGRLRCFYKCSLGAQPNDDICSPQPIKAGETCRNN